MEEEKKLKCWTCGETILHNLIPNDEVYECERCGGLRRVDGTPSLGELMNLPKGKNKKIIKNVTQK